MVCEGEGEADYLCSNGSASSAAKSPESCNSFLLISCHSLCLSAVSSSFSIYPSLRESSDISRVCPAPHSSAASEECLLYKLQLDVDFTVVVVGGAACCSITLYRWLAFSVDCIIHSIRFRLSLACLRVEASVSVSFYIINNSNPQSKTCI